MASNTVKTGNASAAVLLLPIMAAIFGVYIVIGLAMPVLPLYVHQRLGFGPFIVGLVSGSQFAAGMISRFWAGHHVDSRGAKHAVIVGLLVAALSGLFYLFSSLFVQRGTSVLMLLVGRAVLGAAESFVITGALSLGMALMGSHNTGKVMAWVGTALYAAFAAGAPAGTTLYSAYGFRAVALATTLIPLAGLPLLALIRPVASPQGKHTFELSKVAAGVWMPGFGVALAGVGFGAISTFIVLLYAARGWSAAWLPFTVLSVAFIGGRLVFGHLPDKIGGGKVSFVCMLIEAAGQAVIWTAHSSSIALAGVILTGLGYSLVYPGLGVEAIRRAPKESRGLAMGAYTAFLDLSLGITGPALGLIAGWTGLNSVFLASAAVVLCAAGVALRLVFIPAHPYGPVEAGIEAGMHDEGQHAADVAPMETF
jgi:MFS family permease